MYGGWCRQLLFGGLYQWHAVHLRPRVVARGAVPQWAGLSLRCHLLARSLLLRLAACLHGRDGGGVLLGHLRHL